jgi:hypothetical protein
LKKTDFEFAAICALKEVYSNVIVSGCQFHLSQCIWRKIQSMGLVSMYKSNNNIKKFTKVLTALSYVRIGKLLCTFNELKNSTFFQKF